jgi:hypothetical protein
MFTETENGSLVTRPLWWACSDRLREGVHLPRPPPFSPRMAMPAASGLLVGHDVRAVSTLTSYEGRLLKLSIKTADPERMFRCILPVITRETSRRSSMSCT